MAKDFEPSYFASEHWDVLMRENAEKRKNWVKKGGRTRVSAKRQSEMIELGLIEPSPKKKYPAKSRATRLTSDMKRANMLRECEAAYRAKRRRKQADMEASAMWKTCLLAMRPGEWHTVRQICEATGVLDAATAGLNESRRAVLHSAIRRELTAKGLAERTERAREPGDPAGRINGKMVLYRLTDRGAVVQEALS